VAKYIFLFFSSFILFSLFLFFLQPDIFYVNQEKEITTEKNRKSYLTILDKSSQDNKSHSKKMEELQTYKLDIKKIKLLLNDKRDWDKMGSLIDTVSYISAIAATIFSFVLAGLGIYLKKFYDDFKILKDDINNKIDTQLKKFTDKDNEITKRIDDFQESFDEFKNTDNKITFKRKAIEQTLVECLEVAGGNHTKAFSIYIKLIAAYDTLLPCNHSNLATDTPSSAEKKHLEDMQIAATTLHAEKKYVPAFVIDILLDEIKLPASIKKMIMTGKR